jgi:hypothetical protein
MGRTLEFREHLLHAYPDVYTPEALSAMEALAPFNREGERNWGRSFSSLHLVIKTSGARTGRG